MPQRKKPPRIPVTSDEETRARADLDRGRIGVTADPWPAGPKHGLATEAQIKGSHQDLNLWLAQGEAKRVGLSEEEYGAREKEQENPFRCIPATPAQLLTNQPRLIQDVDRLSTLEKFCKTEGKEVTLKDVRRHLADEIDGLLRYLVNGLGYSIRSGRPKISEKSKLIRFKRRVSATIVECRPLLKFAWQNLHGAAWDRFIPSVRRTRQEARLKAAGYSTDHIEAYFNGTANSRDSLAPDMSIDCLESMVEAVAIELVAIREGLDDSGPVYRAYHQPAYPRRKDHRTLNEKETIQKLAEKLLEPRS